MKQPLGSTSVIDLDGQRWALRSGIATRLGHEEKVRGPQVHYTDFGSALIGVEQVTTSRHYAAPIIEKLLRDRGESESTSKVLVIGSDTRGGATRALYHAVPSDGFDTYQQLAEKHNDHHLLVSHLSLMLQQGRKLPGRAVCVLFQHGVNIDVLLLIDGNAHNCFRVTASGSGDAEWQRALRFLADELRLLQDRLETNIDTCQWTDWNPGVEPDLETDTGKLCQWIEEYTGITLEKTPAVNFTVDGQQRSASLPAWLDGSACRAAINQPFSRLLYWSERALPYAALVVAGVSVALALVAFQWRQQAVAMEASYQEITAVTSGINLSAVEAELMQSLQASPSTFALVDNVHRARTVASLASVVADIRDAIPSACRLASLRLDNTGNETRLIVEGWVDADPTSINQYVESFIGALNARGYVVSDNGLMSRRQRSMFQLEMRIDGVNSEV